jgi:beta-lactamase superfamily II metal-dependent hydrolase
MAPSIKYVSEETTPLFQKNDGKKAIAHLLWGDRVKLKPDSENAGDLVKVSARGRVGFVNKTHLSNEPLLELYFIDVGQGDGILIKTPDEKHIMIDGGYKRASQQSGKNAADFIDWKFKKDYGMNSIELDAMIASHNDADHYGGLWDLINPKQQHELDIVTANVNVTRFYHAGVAWFKKGTSRNLGPVKSKKLTLLVDDLDDITELMEPGRDGYKLQGEWAKFMQCVIDKQIPSQRISNKTGSLDQFTSDEFKINVLAPLETEHDGKPAYESLGGTSQNTNGHSITLRLDYKSVKILLTGDLNSASQKRILSFYQNNESELACDIAKSCHHGSDDCSFEFLTHVSAGATVISSGDAEGHCHPRPSIVAASGITGHKTILEDKIITPLIYSTEISRSYKLGKIEQLKIKETGEILDSNTRIDVTYKETNAGDLNPATKTRTFWDKKIVGGIIYGLVNVRTDGKKILCATMSESGNGWDIKTFNSRF